MIRDYIDGDKFENMCDFNIHSPKFQDGKNKYIVYAASADCHKALNFITENDSKQFVLVTHNGDESPDVDMIPSNLIHWYGQNMNPWSHKQSPIPIGLERDRWHPHKKEILFDAQDVEHERLNIGFAQFNPNTFPSERLGMLQSLRNRGVPLVWQPSINGTGFKEYVDNLKKYKYCFCPRGNGIDTHRMWEALYMGCIPIVKSYTTHQFENCDLPILFVNDWDDFEYRDVKGDFNSKLLTASYWENKIRNKLNDPSFS